jgi:hypothetical protein
MNVEALLDSNELQSSIELLDEKGDGVARTVDLDWQMQIVEKQDTATVIRRREQVHCQLVKQNKKWRITSFEPLTLFRPVA